MLNSVINNPFTRVRHINRYREIVAVLIKYGYADIISRIGLMERLAITRAAIPDESHFTTPERMRKIFEELGPTFIKLGQILSTRPDILPPSVIAELTNLQDHVPPTPWEAMKPRIEEQLGAPLEDIFDWIDDKPLGSASLAQVHAARLHTGEDVVIKAQRPGIEQTIEIDLEILYDLASLIAQYEPLGNLTDFPGIAEEFATSIQQELDYRREATYTDRFRANFKGHGTIYIPTIYWQYVTRRVLVMERLYGIKIDQVEALRKSGYNPTEVARISTEAIFKEIFEDSFFHADPHPGNFVVMKGQVIGAMDFGMVGTLTPSDSLALAQLWGAIINGDPDGITEMLVREGLADIMVEREKLRKDVSQMLRKYHGLTLQDIKMNELVPELFGITYRHKLRLSPDLMMLLKAIIMMEGIGTTLDPDFDLFEVSGPYVSAFQRKLLLPATWTPRLARAAGGWMSLLQMTPETVSRILRQLQRGQLQVVIKPEDIEPVLGRIDLASDRLSISILMASLIMGMSLVVPNLSINSVWLQVLVIAAFVGMIGLGIWLLVSMIWKR